MTERAESVYDIRGMTCAACAKRVERALSRVEGVESVQVDLVRERAHVRGTPREAELTRATTDAGYELVRRPSGAKARERSREEPRAIAAALLAALVLAIETLAPHALGMSTPYVTLALTAVVVLGLGGPVFVRALRLAWARDASMDTLVALGSGAALGLGVAGVLGHAGHGAHGHSDASAGALVVALVLVGKALEARAKHRAGDALDRLVLADAAAVRVTRHGATTEIPAAELRAGDVVHLAAYAIVPVDGTLESEHAYVDESQLTGESRPVRKVRGEAVHGGTVNGGSPVSLVVTAVGAATFRGRLERDTAEALSRPPREAALADRASRWVVPVVLVATLASFGYHLARGAPWAEALRSAITVVVIACPCALGLATPAALVAAVGRAAREGIIVRDAGRFLVLARARHLFFDKTGTLTEGKPRVSELVLLGAHDERSLLAWVASVEESSEHPIGRALFLSAMERGIAARPTTDVVVAPGRGISGRVDGHAVSVEVLDGGREASLPVEARAHAAGARRDGRSVSIVIVDDVPAALVDVRDRARGTSARLVAALRREGLSLTMLSGDHEDAARTIAAEVGLAAEAVHASLRPEEKAAYVERARASGTTAMIGDGVNDAPALAAADVGIAVGAASGVALRSAAATLVDGDLARFETARALARATERTIRGNLVWAFAYNAVAIPLAAVGALDRLGGAPAAAAAMALSSIAVVLWSLRLGRMPLAHAA
ncbi:MAG: cation-translocating P-type ATPase [Sandaracinus sp.]